MKRALNNLCVQPLESWLERLRQNSGVKTFSPQEITFERLEQILELGCSAPSPWNIQPWQFVVVRTPAARAKLLRYCPQPGPAAAAPVLVVGLADPAAWKDAPARLSEMVTTGALDAAQEAAHLRRVLQQWGRREAAQMFAIAQTYMALHHMAMLALAWDIDSAWLVEFDAHAIQEAFHIPSRLLVVAVLALGYSQERATAPAVSSAEKIFAEAYGLPWGRSETPSPPPPPKSANKPKPNSP